MRLTKIHRVLVFQQSPWLKTYIDFNTDKRRHAANDFEKDFYKLMNNSVFGKTVENLMKRVNVKLVNNKTKLSKLIASPSFDYFRIFSEDLAAVNMKKTKLYLNRPIYVGFSILDLSKSTHVPVPLRVHETKVWLQRKVVVYRHGQSLFL